MVLTELISEFEILFEDLATAGSKGLDSYEKSICFTFAQKAIVGQLANSGNLTPITSLVATHVASTSTASIYKTGKKYPSVTNPLAIIGYFASNGTKDIPGKPVSQEVIDSLLMMPYQYPPKDLVYVVVGENTDLVFLPLSFTATSFNTRYVKEPPPIILETLTGGTSINGLTAPTLPSLIDEYKDKLVTAAVQYAIQFYIGQQEKEVPGNGSTGN